MEREPTCHEIFAEVSNLYPNIPVHDGFHSDAILYSLLREDKLKTNADCNKFTTREKEGFSNYSELFKTKFEGCTLDSKQRVLCQESVNFMLLQHILKSKGAKEEIDGIKFLEVSPEIKMDQKVCITSYPNSDGNLRRFLGRITGIVSGDSTSLDSTTPLQLRDGLKG